MKIQKQIILSFQELGSIVKEHFIKQGFDFKQLEIQDSKGVNIVDMDGKVLIYLNDEELTEETNPNSLDLQREKILETKIKGFVSVRAYQALWAHSIDTFGKVLNHFNDKENFFKFRNLGKKTGLEIQALLLEKKLISKADCWIA